MKAVIKALYEPQGEEVACFDLTAESFKATLHEKSLLWAPDGDEVFDDGSHVLQFDIGNKVRLVGFVNHADQQAALDTIVEVTLDEGKFYRFLEAWIAEFEVVRLRTQSTN